MDTNRFIPAIYNYCDRWCERCAYVDRCSMGAIEQVRWAKGDDWEPQDFFDELDKLYPLDEQSIPSWLEEAGLDLSDISPDDVPEPDLKTLQLENDMRERAKRYAHLVGNFFKDHHADLLARGIDLQTLRSQTGRDTHERSVLAEAIQVIYWYQHFIFAKASRAVGGMEDMDDEETWGGPYQSDANGSAKVCMIGAERSLAAWELLRRHCTDHHDSVLVLMREINSLRYRMEQLFPDWRKFVRPGFDTERPSAMPFGDN